MHTFSKIAAVTSVLSLAGMEAFAANDWSKPCLQGQCSYDLPASHTASASLKVWGSSSGISDITEAAGWKIIDCDSNSMTPTVRMVCTEPNTASSACNHIMEGGAEHKLVRLPENCGKMPFARVAKSWIPEDQSMPASIKQRRGLFGRAQPVVHALNLDTNFTAVDAEKTGNVSFSAEGLNIAGENGNFTITNTDQRRSYISRPVMFARHASERRGFNPLSILQGKFNKTSKTDLPSVDVDTQKTLLNANVQCQGVSANLEVDIDAKAHSQISLGAVIAGQLVPPGISDFGIIVGYTGDVDATLTMKASADGTFDSGLIPIFSRDVPGLDIPGYAASRHPCIELHSFDYSVLSLDPTFAVNGQVNGDVELELDVSFDLAYNINNAQLQFPPNAGKSSGDATPNDNKFSISASPELVGNAQMTAHLIPEVSISLNAIGGFASANVFLELDASATLDLTGVDAKATGTTGTSGSSGSAAAQGCVDISTGINAHAGAQGKFLNLFDQNTQVTIFNKNFELFQVCSAAVFFASSVGSLCSRNASTPPPPRPTLPRARLLRARPQPTLAHPPPTPAPPPMPLRRTRPPRPPRLRTVPRPPILGTPLTPTRLRLRTPPRPPTLRPRPTPPRPPDRPRMPLPRPTPPRPPILRPPLTTHPMPLRPPTTRRRPLHPLTTQPLPPSRLLLMRLLRGGRGLCARSASARP
ncbi:hypothetical protein DENSPDRAFT_238702 [Dentipellis sp. KUC8613]|nr:hypothetical protein DENSPDRAFT_238702 [Dentipellis sp. KUC8613]